MESGAEAGSEDIAYENRIRSSSLSELEDMFAHVDSGEYPLRARILLEEIERRQAGLEGQPGRQTLANAVPAGIPRRLWASLIDLFIHLLILGALFLAGWSVLQLVSSFGSDGPPPAVVSERRGPSPLRQFVTGLVAGDSAAWKNEKQWFAVVSGYTVFSGFQGGADGAGVGSRWKYAGNAGGRYPACKDDGGTRRCNAGADTVLGAVPSIRADVGRQHPLDYPGQGKTVASRQACGHMRGEGTPHLGKDRRRPDLRLGDCRVPISGCLSVPELLYCSGAVSQECLATLPPIHPVSRRCLCRAVRRMRDGRFNRIRAVNSGTEHCLFLHVHCPAAAQASRNDVISRIYQTSGICRTRRAARHLRTDTRVRGESAKLLLDSCCLTLLTGGRTVFDFQESDYA